MKMGGIVSPGRHDFKRDSRRPCDASVRPIWRSVVAAPSRAA